MSAPPVAPQPAPEGSWRIMAGAFLANFAGFGGAYTFSAFFSSLQSEFGASRTAVSLAFSLAACLYFSLGLVSGRIADRGGARPLVLAGLAVMAIGLALAGLARSVVEVYLAYGLGVGLGVGLSYVPGLGAVQKAFDRRRGFASGVAVAGIGVGTLFMPPLATELIAALGWRGAYLVLALVVLAVGVVAAWLIGPAPPTPARAAGPASSLEGAIRSPAFRRLYMACLLAGFGAFLPFAHLVPYAADQGLSPRLAAMLVAAVAVGSTAGRFVVGDLADKIGRQPSLLACFAGMGLCLAAWPFARALGSLAAFALLYGLAYGAWVALLPAYVADRFGARNAGGVIGALYTGVGVGALVGPSLAGWAFDTTGGYAPALFAAAAADGLATWFAATAASRVRCAT